jgi:hypothetical protein
MEKWYYSRNGWGWGGQRRMMEGVKSSMMYYKNFCKCHNVLPLSTTIKKVKKNLVWFPFSNLSLKLFEKMLPISNQIFSSRVEAWWNKQRPSSVGIVIHIFVETTQWNSLCSYLYLKLAKMPCFSFYLLCFFFYKIRE